MLFDLIAASGKNSKIKYLYKDGAMYEPLSGGFNGYGTITSNNNVLKYTTSYNSETSNYVTWMLTNNVIDLTGYNWLYVDFAYVNQANIYIGFKGTNSNDNSKVIDAGINIAQSSGGVYKMPLNGLNSGSYKFGIACDGIAEGDNCTINSIWISSSDNYDATTCGQASFTISHG